MAVRPMTTVDAGGAIDARLYRIGELAEQLSISTRTLRYYEQVGLITPSGRTAGGSRRYTEQDRDRVAHIRKLQDVMGFDLERIRVLLCAEDELGRLRAEYRAGPPPERIESLVDEALLLYERMLAQVDEKQAMLAAFRSELETKMANAKSARRRAVTGARRRVTATRQPSPTARS